MVALIVHFSSVGTLIPSPKLQEIIDDLNRRGPYLGIVVPNAFEMNHLLQSSAFNLSSTLDIAGYHLKNIKIKKRLRNLEQ